MSTRPDKPGIEHLRIRVSGDTVVDIVNPRGALAVIQTTNEHGDNETFTTFTGEDGLQLLAALQAAVIYGLHVGIPPVLLAVALEEALQNGVPANAREL